MIKACQTFPEPLNKTHLGSCSIQLSLEFFISLDRVLHLTPQALHLRQGKLGAGVVRCFDCRTRKLMPTCAIVPMKPDHQGDQHVRLPPCHQPVSSMCLSLPPAQASPHAARPPPETGAQAAHMHPNRKFQHKTFFRTKRQQLVVAHSNS